MRERNNSGPKSVPWRTPKILAVRQSAHSWASGERDLVGIHAPLLFYSTDEMSGKRSRSFKCAVHHRDREVSSENDFHVLLEEPPLFRRMVQIIADEFLTEERDRKYYADNYTCYPPPFFILFITVVEVSDH
ncbi:Rhomboid- protein 3 [Homalodisca vitripennis]|nr:Rhomboid- protein 3 [Homalodisca vitripennis]